MRIAIDTDRYRDLCDGKRDVVERLETAEAIFVPFIVLGELRAGFAAGTKGQANERVLHRFLAQPGVDVLHTTEATTRSYAALYRQLRTQGTPIRPTTCGSPRSCWSTISPCTHATSSSRHYRSCS